MMTNKKRNFQWMSYRDVQRANSKNRQKLHKQDQVWLQENDYKNVGWDNVVKLYEKIREFLDKYQFEDLTLEELFLEADRIGNKYQTPEEREDYNRRLAEEVNEIAEKIERQFSQTEIEFIDFSKNNKNQYPYKKNQKLSRTTKL